MSIDYRAEIERLKKELPVTVVGHYYQRDEVFEMADITGDSLELARRCDADNNPLVAFGGFLGTMTNNEAEYSGLVAALEWARSEGIRELHIRELQHPRVGRHAHPAARDEQLPRSSHYAGVR